MIENKVKEYPLDLQKIVQNNGWQIVSKQKLSATKIPGIKNLEGATLVIDKKHVIVYDSNCSRQRNRFTVAHEIGHIVLRHKSGKKKIEKEANMFAARILMPMILIKELEAAGYRLKRYNEIIARGKYLTHRLERKLLRQLKNFIRQRRNS